jgi:perosamine synthetase
MSSVTHMNIIIARTPFLESEIRSVMEPSRSGWLVQGLNVREFEDKFSAFTGAKHSIAVTSCNTGLHLSLAA